MFTRGATGYVYDVIYDYLWGLLAGNGEINFISVTPPYRDIFKLNNQR